MNIVLTGATGFIGSHVARRLLVAGHRVTAVVRPASDPWRIKDLLPSLTLLEGDLSVPLALRGPLISALVNLAGALLLIPPFGINGVAVATLLGHGTAAAMMLVSVQGRLGIPTLRFAVIGLPIVLMAAYAAILEGMPLYLAGTATMVVSSVALSRAFKLLSRDTLGELMRLEMPVFIKSGFKVLSEKAG